MRRWLVLLLISLLAAGCTMGGASRQGKRPELLRLGYFPNLTHAQAVIGMADGSLEKAAGVKIEPHLFAAGPAAIAALFAGEIDLLYVGPAPAVNGYIRSHGEALRVIAGAASGGAVFVLREGVAPARLGGLRLGTPQMGNTQDIALRHQLSTQGLKSLEQGGNVQVIPTAPTEMLALFARGELDGAWVPEPWGARLMKETGAKLALDERDLWPDRTFATTVLVVSSAYLKSHREQVKGFLEGHVALTKWIKAHPNEARTALRNALAQLQGKPLPDDLLGEALSRIDFTHDPMAESVVEQARRAHKLGFLGHKEPVLTDLFDLRVLREVAP